MTELLHWAIEHSDPARLAEVMQRYKEQNLTIRDVYGQDVIDALFRDEAADMMKLVARIIDFRNMSMSDDELDTDLERLQEFVEQIDNAANLHRMGGLQPLLDLALEPVRSPGTRRLALWTLGVTVQNNPSVQADLVGLGGLQRLASRLPRCGAAAGAPAATQDREEAEDLQYCGKLLFTLSGLVKNNATTQASATELGVFDWLLRVGITHSSVAVVKKSLGLLETALAQSPDLQVLETLPHLREELARTLLAHVLGPAAERVDPDLAEKALRLINRILSLRPMLFAPTFRPELAAAVRDVTQRCEGAFGAGDELCAGLAGLAGHANLMLTASDIADEDL